MIRPLKKRFDHKGVTRDFRSVKVCKTKLQSLWEVPYSDVTRTNHVVYRSQKGSRTKTKFVHLHHLASCQKIKTDRDDLNAEEFRNVLEAACFIYKKEAIEWGTNGLQDEWAGLDD